MEVEKFEIDKNAFNGELFFFIYFLYDVSQILDLPSPSKTVTSFMDEPYYM